MSAKESEYICKSCENTSCWLCKGNTYYDRVMESKLSNAKEHKSDIALYRDFIRFKGCCSHSALKDTKYKYWEYRSHSGHLYMILYELLGEEYVESHELDECLKMALNKIDDYEDLVNVTDEEIRGLEDIIGFAFAHRNGTKWEELTYADNLYHKIKNVYLLKQIKKLYCKSKMPQEEIDKIRDMTIELEKSLVKNPFDDIKMTIYNIELRDESGFIKERIIFNPIRHVDGD